MTLSSDLTRIVRVALLLLCVAWGAASLSYPFGWDQGIMASVGDALLHGSMPHRDAWDIKGPVAHVWFATGQLLFGRGQLGIRALDLALLTWAAFALARTGRQLTRSSAGAWLAIGLVLSHASVGYFYTAQPDGAVSFALTVAFAPLFVPTPTRRALAMSGVVIGIAMLMKPLYGVFLLVPGLVVLQTTERPLAARVQSLLIVGIATALPVAAMLGWFAARGALDEMFDVYIRYNASSYSGVTDFSLRQRAMGVVRYFLPWPRAIALLAMLAGSATLLHRDRRRALLIFGWFLGALALVVSQGKFFVYHWAVIFPYAALLVAVGITALTEAGQPATAAPTTGPTAAPTTARTPATRMRSALGATMVLAIVLPLAHQPASDAMHWVRFVSGGESRAQYYARFGLDDRRYVAADQMAAAEFIRANTTDRDRVAIFGYVAPVLFLSGRANATRYSYALPLVGHRSSSVFRTTYRRDYMASLADVPAYVVVGLLFSGKERTLDEFPEFKAYLAQHFALQRSFGNVDVYRRQEGVPAAP
ncbi:MAG: glycosyltransferase family 39 protein [Gemmatimonadaceae bacterium]